MVKLVLQLCTGLAVINQVGLYNKVFAPLLVRGSLLPQGGLPFGSLSWQVPEKDAPHYWAQGGNIVWQPSERQAPQHEHVDAPLAQDLHKVDYTLLH